MQENTHQGFHQKRTKMKKFLFILAVLSLAACHKDGLGFGEKGFVSVNGEKVIQLDYGYEADMSSIGMGKGCWHIFEKSQKRGDLDYEQYVVRLRSGVDPDSGDPYPFSIFVRDFPGCEAIYIDGLKRSEDGRYQYRERKFVAEGEAPRNVDYTVTVDQFSYNAFYTNLKVDITIVSDAATVRIVYSGSTPNDGMEYYVN